jgi:spore cortex formation protein SpoVR/YcgB (stage V sporulation)
MRRTPQQDNRQGVVIVNNVVRMALAVAGGYLLGRGKYRLAAALAIAGVTGHLRAGKGDLLQQGLKMLTSSPEVEKIIESVRSDLLDAGKDAAKAAVSNQIDSLSSRLHDRAESLRNPEQAEEEEEEEEFEERRKRHGKATRSREKSRPRDEEEEEEPEEEEEEEEEAPARPRSRAPSRRGSAPPRTRRAPARARG